MHSQGALRPSKLRPQMSIKPSLKKNYNTSHKWRCFDKFSWGFDEGLYRQQKSFSLFMDDWGYEGFKYKKDVIKREGISLAEALKKAEWSKLVNNNLQVWQQSEPVNIMHYQYSSWIPLNRITNRDEEMESQK